MKPTAEQKKRRPRLEDTGDEIVVVSVRPMCPTWNHDLKGSPG